MIIFLERFLKIVLFLCLIVSCTSNDFNDLEPKEISGSSGIAPTALTKSTPLFTSEAKNTSTEDVFQETLPTSVTNKHENSDYIVVEDVSGAIYYIEPDNGFVQVLFPEQSFTRLIAISEDGCEVVVKDKIRQIVGLDLDGNIVREYLPSNWYQGTGVVGMEALSPDENFLSYIVGTGVASYDSYEKENIEIIQLENHIVTKITENGGVRTSAWSPDSLMLAFSDYDENELHQLYLFNVITKQKIQLSSFSESDSQILSVHWSPESERLVFSVFDSKTEEISIGIVSMGKEKGVTRLLPLSFTQVDNAWWLNEDMLVFQVVMDNTSEKLGEKALVWFDTSSNNVVKTLLSSDTPDNELMFSQEVSSSKIGFFSNAHYFTYDFRMDILTQHFEHYFGINRWLPAPSICIGKDVSD